MLIRALQCAEMPGKQTVGGKRNCGEKAAAAALHKMRIKVLLNYQVDFAEGKEE